MDKFGSLKKTTLKEKIVAKSANKPAKAEQKVEIKNKKHKK